MNDLNALIDEVFKDTNHPDNPYFLNLRGKTFDKDDFTETQIQFYFAVIFFSRPMSTLAAKIPSADLRIEVLRNVWEEHGEGSLSSGHGNTFLLFLNKLGNISIDQVNLRVLWPEVRIFNTTLAGATVLDNFLVGVGMLGMIERMFSEISSWIGNSVVENGWIAESEMIHYNLHSELDVKHSQDFFNILIDPFSKNDENKYHIEQGLRLGATLFDNLYLGLWGSCKRRWLLETPIPPSITANYNP